MKDDPNPMNRPPVTEQELQAFVDDLLPAARRVEIEAYLRARPAEAERIAAYREQNRLLHSLFDPVLQESVPLPLAERPPVRRAANQSRWRQFAACAAFAITGGIAGWLLHAGANPASPQTAQLKTVNGNLTLVAADMTNGANSATGASADIASDMLARHAAIAHATFIPEVRHPVEVGADQEAHLVAWLSKRLGTTLRPPKLNTLGYDLIGGRLLPGDEGPVAQFMYQDTTGHRMTLYVSTEQNGKQETGFRFSQEGGLSVFYWIDGKFGYALSAALPKAALGRLADMVYRQLETPG